MRVSALWLLGSTTLLVGGSLGWTVVATPLPSSRILSPAVVVTLAAAPPADPSAALGSATDADDTRSSADPQAGGDRSGSASTDGPAAGSAGAATGGGTVPTDPDWSFRLGPLWPSTDQGRLPANGSESPPTAGGTFGTPAAVTTARPTSAPVLPVISTTSPSAAPHTVTVTRVRTLSDDHKDDHEDDHKDDRDDHDSHDD